MNNNISVAPLYEDYLAHHQIKGAKWGVMHGPPYPLSRGKGGSLPKIKKITSEAKKRREEQRAQKAETKAEEKKAKLRKYIIEHPKALYAHKEMFTKAELEDILKEIDFDQKLRDVQRGQFKKTVDSIKDVAALTTSIKNITSGAIDIYKNSQNIRSILRGKGIFGSKDDEETGSDSSDTKDTRSSDTKKNKSASGSNSDSGDLSPELKMLLGVK